MCHKLSTITDLHKRAKGNIGEDVACRFLCSEGFIIVDRNYQKRWGELDIVALKEKSLHFFEVKSVTRNFPVNSPDLHAHSDFHRPEDNVHSLKVRHLRKIIQTYLAEKRKGPDMEFYFHILCVFMNIRTRRARVQWIKDIIL
jgi:Holliday junction resolvase-like predicted endonuclease